MLNHIGITVEKSDIDPFYQKILGFEITREFKLEQSIAEKIFSISNEVEVLVLKKDDAILEAFIYKHNGQSFFNHISLNTDSCDALAKQSKNAGYQVVFHKGKVGKTIFIKDGVGNVFEMKQL